jgi:transcriptional regulator with XRE-family HTH domain
MNWSEFLEGLLRSFRTSTYELEKNYGIPSAIFSNIKKGKTKKPSQSTIKKIEEALQIKIDDSNPEDIKIIDLPPQEKHTTEGFESIKSYPLIESPVVIKSKLKPGLNYGLFTPEYIKENAVASAYFDYEGSEHCAAIRSTKDHAGTAINKGDIILFDFKAVPNNGDTVGIIWNGEPFIGRYKKISEETFALSIGEDVEIFRFDEVPLSKIVQLLKTYS